MEGKMDNYYDIIVVGGGPAGLTAAIYALRARKSVLLIERFVAGGQVAITTNIENYPGFEAIDGQELSKRMFNQAKKLGMDVVYSDVQEYKLDGDLKTIRTYKSEYTAKAVILCMGVSARQLEVDNEKRFVGRGLSYCATCDGNFFRDKDVAVVGGGNTSFEDCLYLANIVNKIYLIHRRDAFRGDECTLGKLHELEQMGKLEFVYNSTVIKLEGDDKVNGVVVQNKIDKTERGIPVSAVFVAIGRKADTNLLSDKLNLDDNGYIVTDEDMRTNIRGVYAAGDIRHKKLRQIVTATADGAIAAVTALEVLR